MLKENEARVLKALGERELDAPTLAEKTGLPESSLLSIAVALEEKGFISIRKVEVEQPRFTAEGEKYKRDGLPERRLLNAVAKKEELAHAVAKAQLTSQEQGIALQWAVKTGWLHVEKSEGKTFLLRKSGKESDAEKALCDLQQASKEGLQALMRRKLAETKTAKRFFFKATGKTVSESAGVTRLTPEMLKTGAWKEKRFQSYDLSTLVARAEGGRKHAYKQFLLGIKHKLAGMGFVEAHGPLVELEFWNMDALFMAQDHPAREIHDVFQVEDPARGEILDKELLKRVQQAHESGLEGSEGWRYKWDAEIAARLVLRSHTTPVSARALAKGLKPPQRVFCIGRVFRPDEIDWKHFIEFNQCEGIVMDENMSFRELLGYLKEFAVEVFGAQDVRFVPDYFPFTEPSVEMHAKIPGKGWAEVGGAGMFRPEMLSALNVKVPVLAWGLGIDRLAMIKLGTKDIRDLFTQDLGLLRR